MAVSITFDGLDLEVSLYHEPYEAPTLEHPGQPEYWEVEAALCGDDDLLPAMTKAEVAAITTLAVAKAAERDNDDFGDRE